MTRGRGTAPVRPLHIGDLAAASGLTRDTLRYYERLGLLAPAKRTSGNFRTYEPATLDRLRFIKVAQSHGLSLGEIRELIGSRVRAGRDQCRRVRDLLSRRLSELEEKRDELGAFCDALRQHLAQCDRALESPRESDCPVVDDLSA